MGCATDSHTESAIEVKQADSASVPISEKVVEEPDTNEEPPEGGTRAWLTILGG